MSIIKRGYHVKITRSNGDCTARVMSKKKNGWLKVCVLTPEKHAGMVFSVRNSHSIILWLPEDGQGPILESNYEAISPDFDGVHKRWIHEGAPLATQSDNLFLIWSRLSADEHLRWNNSFEIWAAWVLV